MKKKQTNNEEDNKTNVPEGTLNLQHLMTHLSRH